MTAPSTDDKRPASRFARWPAWPARLALLAMALLILAPQPDMGRFHRLTPHSPPDYTLYRDVVARMSAGQDYYAATSAALRAQGRPTAPALVFREPAAALLLTALRTDALRWGAVIALAAVAVLALIGGVEQVGGSLVRRIAMLMLMATGLLNAASANAPYFHELWAGLLMVVSLGLYRPGRWAPSMGVGVLACLVRELCLPYLLIMAAFALFERRWREALGWLAGVAVFCGLFAVHLALAQAQIRPGDPTGPSWLAFGGWPFLLGIAHWNPFLLAAPGPVVAVFLCVAVIGLAGATNPWVQRIAAVVIAYLAAFCIIGRPDNHYWGLLIAPLLPLGLAFAPAALADLVKASFPFAQAKTT
jgi:hypothetical protein